MDARDKHAHDSTDGKIERAKDNALGSHDSDPSHLDELGEATGGIAGVLAGAGIGSAAGPVGTLIGGIAGAIGGWWSGRAVTEAASTLTEDDERYFRGHFELQPNRPADRSYDDMRGVYYLGHIASRNPAFASRDWGEVEPELSRGWTGTGDKFGSWVAVRPYAAEGFSRGRSKLDQTDARMKSELEGRTPGELPEQRY